MTLELLCAYCNNLTPLTEGTAQKNSLLTCKAFPGGIPADIISGKIEHTRPYSGDKGIRFEPIPLPDISEVEV